MFHDKVTAREALAYSLNVPAVATLEKIGPDAFAARLESAGVRLVRPKTAIVDDVFKFVDVEVEPSSNTGSSCGCSTFLPTAWPSAPDFPDQRLQHVVERHHSGGPTASSTMTGHRATLGAHILEQRGCLTGGRHDEWHLDELGPIRRRGVPADLQHCAGLQDTDDVIERRFVNEQSAVLSLCGDIKHRFHVHGCPDRFDLGAGAS